jgi:virulence factor Mce-like protein
MLGIRTLVVAALGSAALVALVVVLSGGGGDGFRLRAELGDAEGVRDNYVVRVDGIAAGRVTAVDVTRRDTAIVSIELDHGAGIVGRDARVSARAANLLGEKYLDLSLGDRARPLPEGSLVPLSRTRSEVQLDDILNTLAPNTRARLRVLINELGIGVSGRGADFNALLQRLPGTLRDSGAVLAQLASENAALGRLITRSDVVLTTIDHRRDTPARFVRSVDALTATLAAKRRELAATIQAAPATLRQTRGSLQRLAGTARRLQPAAALLRRSAPELTNVLAAIPGFATSASGTLATARQVAPELTRLGRRGTPDLEALDRTLQKTATFAHAMRPLSESLGRGGVVAGILELMQSWDRTINAGDGVGRFFRLRAAISPSALTSLVTRLTPKPPARGKARKPSAKAPAALTKVAEASGGKPKPQSGNAVDRVTKPLTDTLDKTRKTVTGLLDYLLK